MTMDQRQQVALFRYSVIAPLETGTSDPAISNKEFFRQAAKKVYTGPAAHHRGGLHCRKMAPCLSEGRLQCPAPAGT